jgi:CRP/FNR family transcriptional regulator
MPAAVALKTTSRTIFMSQAATPVGARKFEVTCTSCNLRELCLTGCGTGVDIERVENIVYARRRVKRGESLFKSGDAFNAVYAVRSGFFKTSLIGDDGREQVTGFFMGGELIGLDGIGTGACNATAIALEDSEVCVMPYTLIEEMAREVPALQRHLHAVLAREIVRDHGVMMLLGSMRAEERLATFLLNLSKRFVRRGYSASDFHLRMTREEIGSFLGLKLETVSRLFSQFQKDGYIEVEQKHVRIVDIAGLERILSSR